MTFGKYALTFFLISAAAGTAFAQGGSGGGKSEPSPSVRRSMPRRYSRPIARRVPRVYIPPAPRVGSLVVSVNEPGSEIVISDANGIVVNRKAGDVANDSPAIRVGALPLGSYRIVVRKPGFFDERRTVKVLGGRATTSSISMRPSAAYLTVIVPNVRDATLTLGSADFVGALRRHPVQPGTYKLTVKRNGYIPESRNVRIGARGNEYTEIVSLKLMSIYSLMEQAEDEIDKGNYTRAAELAGQAVDTDPERGRANLLLGLSKVFAGDAAGAAYLVKAIRSGSTARIPVRLLAGRGEKKVLFKAVVSVDRDELTVRSTARGDLALTNLKRRSVDAALESPGTEPKFISITSTDAKTKPGVEPLTLYSSRSAVRANRTEVFCPGHLAEGTCDNATTALYALLSEWSKGDR
jgi:hypothetical protein